MTKNTDKATAAHGKPELPKIETLTWEAWKEPKPRNYDDAMVEDLAKTHAQTLVKLDKAQAHADKLADALREISNALDAPHRFDLGKALLQSREALRAYEEGKQ